MAQWEYWVERVYADRPAGQPFTWFFGSPNAALYDGLAAAGRDSWELVGVHPLGPFGPTAGNATQSALYIFKRPLQA